MLLSSGKHERRQTTKTDAVFIQGFLACEYHPPPRLSDTSVLDKKNMQ